MRTLKCLVEWRRLAGAARSAPSANQRLELSTLWLIHFDHFFLGESTRGRNFSRSPLKCKVATSAAFFMADPLVIPGALSFWGGFFSLLASSKALVTLGFLLNTSQPSCLTPSSSSSSNNNNNNSCWANLAAKSSYFETCQRIKAYAHVRTDYIMFQTVSTPARATSTRGGGRGSGTCEQQRTATSHRRLVSASWRLRRPRDDGWYFGHASLLFFGVQ